MKVKFIDGPHHGVFEDIDEPLPESWYIAEIPELEPIHLSEAITPNKESFKRHRYRLHKYNFGWVYIHEA